MIGGTIQAALFIGERIEYQVEVAGQSEVIMIYGERHQPIDEGNKVWLKLRPEGHSAWPSDWSLKEAIEKYGELMNTLYANRQTSICRDGSDPSYSFSSA